ncbi:MAG TPA: NAD(P)/FAD-dependent oxidoreductase [Pseudobdellovibrionaceae bacterium]|nr:NAD(P)/FAD-dependent oxidoreductase [Pseudobdellovibrionaceae bacterium]
MKQKKKVIIVGGGFAGLNAARSFVKDDDFEITLIDRRNYHLFQPLLYQVAMAGLGSPEIAIPIRSIFSNSPNIKVLMTEVKSVNFINNEISTVSGPLLYDYLILACGVRQSYFGNDHWEEFAPGLKTLEQAREIRRRVFSAFENAETEKDLELQRKYLTFVVIGGGPTGVELAGALGEITRHTLAREFRHIDASRTRIILIEAGSRILPSFHPTQSSKATRDLEKIGVTVWTNTRVKNIDTHGVDMGNEFLKSATILWAAGVSAPPINYKLGVELDPMGRVYINPDLSIPDHSNVFVLGDQAHFKDKNDKPLPGIAPVATQQGRFIQKVLRADINDEVRPSFKYFDKGQMATIGRSKAIIEIGGLRMHGLFAWIAWLVVHIFYLIGFKNRMIVMIHWLWAYATYGRGARLIGDSDWRVYKKDSH